MIRGLIYKLWVFEIPIDGPTNVVCDNQSVCNNAQMPTSILKKKSSCHMISPSEGTMCGRCNEVSMGEWKN